MAQCLAFVTHDTGGSVTELRMLRQEGRELGRLGAGADEEYGAEIVTGPAPSGQPRSIPAAQDRDEQECKRRAEHDLFLPQNGAAGGPEREREERDDETAPRDACVLERSDGADA